MIHVCVNELGHHWLKCWATVYLVPHHQLNTCRVITITHPTKQYKIPKTISHFHSRMIRLLSCMVLRFHSWKDKFTRKALICHNQTLPFYITRAAHLWCMAAKLRVTSCRRDIDADKSNHSRSLACHPFRGHSVHNYFLLKKWVDKIHEFTEGQQILISIWNKRWHDPAPWVNWFNSK